MIRLAIVWLGCCLMLSLTSQAQCALHPDSVLYVPGKGTIQSTRISGDSLSTLFSIYIEKHVPLHKHAFHSEHVFIRRGFGTMLLGRDTLEVHAGSYVFIPQGTPHAVWVKSAEPMHVWSIQSPGFDGSDRILIK